MLHKKNHIRIQKLFITLIIMTFIIASTVTVFGADDNGASDLFSSFGGISPAALIAFFVIILIAVLVIFGLILVIIHQKTRSKLAISEARAEAAENSRVSVSHFLSNMSHDMRTPLNGIIGFTRLAREEHDERLLHEYLELISNSGKLMIDILNDTLDISKIESGNMNLHEDDFLLDGVVSTLISNAEVISSGKNINFSSHMNIPSGTLLRGDKAKLSQIFLNLINNALTYTEEKGDVNWQLDATITEDKEKCLIRSVISDNGIGMSKDFQNIMYDPFTKEHRIPTESTMGSGLGLAIVKRFVDLMGGTIEVDSAPGEGTTFTVVLEFALRGTGIKHEENIGDLNDSLLMEKRFLICEDNTINAELIEILLMKHGAGDVTICMNGLEGVDTFAASDPDFYSAIIMDVNMPVMDGLEATKKIRALPREDSHNIPILALTADAFREDMEKCRAAGMNEHLAKPVNPNELIQVLMRYI